MSPIGGKPENMCSGLSGFGPQETRGSLGVSAERDYGTSADGAVPHCSLMFAARITLPHFSVSSAMCLPNSAGELGNTELLNSASRAFVLGSARIAVVSLLSLSMISGDVFLAAARDHRGQEESDRHERSGRITPPPGVHFRCGHGLDQFPAGSTDSPQRHR